MKSIKAKLKERLDDAQARDNGYAAWQTREIWDYLMDSARFEAMRTIRDYDLAALLPELSTDMHDAIRREAPRHVKIESRQTTAKAEATVIAFGGNGASR